MFHIILKHNLNNLKDELKTKNLFIDEDIFCIGDDIKNVIKENASILAIVIFSKSSINDVKFKQVVNELSKLERKNKSKIILPILENIKIEDVEKFYPTISGKICIDINEGVNNISEIIFSEYTKLKKIVIEQCRKTDTSFLGKITNLFEIITSRKWMNFITLIGIIIASAVGIHKCNNSKIDDVYKAEYDTLYVEVVKLKEDIKDIKILITNYYNDYTANKNITNEKISDLDKRLNKIDSYIAKMKILFEGNNNNNLEKIDSLANLSHIEIDSIYKIKDNLITDIDNNIILSIDRLISKYDNLQLEINTAFLKAKINFEDTIAIFNVSNYCNEYRIWLVGDKNRYINNNDSLISKLNQANKNYLEINQEWTELNK